MFAENPRVFGLVVTVAKLTNTAVMAERQTAVRWRVLFFKKSNKGDVKSKGPACSEEGLRLRL